MKSRRRKKWLFIILGILAVLASVLVFVLVSSGIYPTNPALLYRSDRNMNSVAWSPDGKYIVSPGPDTTVQIWEALTGRLIVNYKGHSAPVNTAAWSPDGKYIASASFDGITQVWDAKTGQRLLIFRKQQVSTDDLDLYPLSQYSAAWSPDGKEIASAGDVPRKVLIWDAKTGNIRLTLPGVSLGGWSPDGKKIASIIGYTVDIWDAYTGVLILSKEDPSAVGPLGSMAWSPDGKYIVSACPDQPYSDRAAQVWDTATGTTRAVFKGHDDVISVAWSPDGKKIASGSSTDGTVQIWDPFTGKHYVTYMPPRFLNLVLEDWARSVAWSPDGNYLASATGSVQIWKAP